MNKRKSAVIGVLGLLGVLALGIGGALSGWGTSRDSGRDPSETATSDQASATTAVTAAQATAVSAAEMFVRGFGYSRLGLVEQLTSGYGSGFAAADAEYAVDHIEVDWNQEALEKAQQHLDTSAFSRKGLIEQLTSDAGERFTPESDAGDMFTLEQAEFAVDRVKVDWNREALEKGRSHLGTSDFTRRGLIDQLSSEAGDGFTTEQATSAVDQLGL